MSHKAVYISNKKRKFLGKGKPNIISDYFEILKLVQFMMNIICFLFKY